MILEIPPVADNVIELHPKHSPLEPKRVETYCVNHCQRVLVCEQTRDLECQDCGRTIEAFDWMWKLACEGRTHLDFAKRAQEERKVAFNELEAVKEALKSERAKLRRANPDHDLALTPHGKWMKLCRERRARIGEK